MESTIITLTRQTPDGFLAAKVGRHYIAGNRAPYFTVTGSLYKSRRAWEMGAEPHSSGAIGETVARAFPEVAIIERLHLASSITGEPMHGPDNGWYWLSGKAAAGTIDARERPYGGYDPEYGRVPDHRDDDGSLSPDFARAYVERAARALRCDHAELPNVQDPELFAEWIETMRPRWQAEADEANALIDRLAAETTEDEPHDRSEERCTIELGEGAERVTVTAEETGTDYRDGVGEHFTYRVVVRDGARHSYTTTYGGSVADYEADRHDARGACNCVLRELVDALGYSSGEEWAEMMGWADPDDDPAEYRRLVRALDRCVSAAERMRPALEMAAEVIA